MSQRETVMNTLRIRRIAAALAGLACACLGLAVAAPAACAQALGYPTHEGMPASLVRQALLRGEDLASMSGSGRAALSEAPAVTRTVVVGGTPGWQIALIVIGAALLAAAAAVLLDRTWAARHRPDNSIRAAASTIFGQPDEDREFRHGRAEIVGDYADLIGTADLAVPRTHRRPR
jgi:hypothetical protein